MASHPHSSPHSQPDSRSGPRAARKPQAAAPENRAPEPAQFDLGGVGDSVAARAVAARILGRTPPCPQANDARLLLSALLMHLDFVQGGDVNQDHLDRLLIALKQGRDFKALLIKSPIQLCRYAAAELDSRETSRLRQAISLCLNQLAQRRGQDHPD